MRRALLDAGYVVLAVDYPGYGASPLPAPITELAAWDPLPTARAALQVLRTMPEVNGIVTIGHSMGTTDAMRLLSTESQLLGTMVFGAALPDPSKDEFWYGRFHTDRRMRTRLPRELVQEIRRQFQDKGRPVSTLSPDHAPIVFVRFGVESVDTAATRDTLYNAIPGHKMVWDLTNFTHYFNTEHVAGVIVGDTQTIHMLTSWFRLLAGFLHEDDGFDSFCAQVSYCHRGEGKTTVIQDSRSS
jgi:pimeloyl-ACP methyl ester carboxylesterase